MVVPSARISSPMRFGRPVRSPLKPPVAAATTSSAITPVTGDDHAANRAGQKVTAMRHRLRSRGLRSAMKLASDSGGGGARVISPLI